MERSFGKVLLCGLSEHPRQLTFIHVGSNPSRLSWDNYLFYVKYISYQLQLSTSLFVHFYIFIVSFTPITKYNQVPLELPRIADTSLEVISLIKRNVLK